MVSRVITIGTRNWCWSRTIPVRRPHLTTRLLSPLSYSIYGGIPCHRSHYISHEDTICALASAKGRAGLSVIRISGPGARDALHKLCVTPRHLSSLVPRMATLMDLVDPNTGHPLDKALVISFPGPNSYTGEDVVELHVHGSPSVVHGTIHAITALGTRVAVAGEFTRRAYENGKLSLPQVEGLADLLNADTELQRSRALHHLSGQTTAIYRQWRAELVRASAHLSALLDFAEDDHIEETVYPDIQHDIRAVITSMKDHLARAVTAIAVDTGLQVALLGPPNTGKSSLLNKLAQRDIAIVSEHAGTTRDIIETRLNLSGNPWTVFDTAGLRRSEDVIEKEGMKRALARIEKAAVKVVVLSIKNETEWDGMKDEIMTSIRDPESIVILNKADLVYESCDPDLLSDFESMHASPAFVTRMLSSDWAPDVIEVLRDKAKSNDVLLVSIHNPGNVSFVLQRLAHASQLHLDSLALQQPARDGNAPVPSVITNARHQQLITACVQALESAVSLTRDEETGLMHGLELAAEDVRHAIQCVGEITGQGVAADEIWDVMFNDFCIGK